MRASLITYVINSLAGYCAFFRPNTYNILKLTLVQNRDTGHGCSVSFFLLGMCLFKKEMVGFHVLVSFFSEAVEILKIFSGIQLFKIMDGTMDVSVSLLLKRHILKCIKFAVMFCLSVSLLSLKMRVRSRAFFLQRRSKLEMFSGITSCSKSRKVGPMFCFSSAQNTYVQIHSRIDQCSVCLSARSKEQPTLASLKNSKFSISSLESTLFKTT
jgi:hypothetical protein